jgi:FixJ family two-component response regulator
MLRLMSQKILGRRVLVVEPDGDSAAALRMAVLSQGGLALGPTDSAADALSYIATAGPVDCIMVDTRLAASIAPFIPEFLKDRGVEVIFVTGHDDWFDLEEDDIEDVWTGAAMLAIA